MWRKLVLFLFFISRNGFASAMSGHEKKESYLYRRILDTFTNCTYWPMGLDTDITSISCGSSDIEGVFPDFIYNLSSLQNLDLSHNDLNGTLSSKIANLAKLTSLNLQDNKFSGSIPTQLGRLTLLTSLDISDNKIIGNIPEFLVNMSSLVTIDLNNNDLEGSIPDVPWEYLQSLKYLKLGGNSLIGTIPLALARIPDAFVIDLSENNLEGCLPEAFNSTCNYLGDVEGNGATTCWFGNQLCGEVPFCGNNHTCIYIAPTFAPSLTPIAPPVSPTGSPTFAPQMNTVLNWAASEKEKIQTLYLITIISVCMSYFL